MAMQNWVRMPTAWIEAGGLSAFSWKENGVEGLAALMVLMVITQHADQETGVTRLTYDQLRHITGLSKTTIAGGLGILEGRYIDKQAQSVYALRDYDPQRFGMLPAKRLYNDKGELVFFKELTRRKPVELNAMKFYFLVVSRRDRETNMAHISYDTIEGYTKMARDDIKKAIAFLGSTSMVYTEHLTSTHSRFRVSNAYRLAHLDSYRHMGTFGRSSEAAELFGGLSGEL